MCADSSEHCMVSSKQLVLGTPGLIAISPVLASPKVKWMQTVSVSLCSLPPVIKYSLTK